MAKDFSASVVIETATAKKGLQDLAKETQSVDKALAALGKTLRENQAALASSAQQMAVLSKAFRDGAQARIADAKAESQAVSNEAKRAAVAQRTAAASATQALEEQRRASARASDARAAMYNGRETRGAASFASAQRAASASTDELGNSLSNTRYLLYDVGATYRTIGIALLAIPAATTAVAASYEKDFAQVIRTTQSTAYASEGLRQDLKKLATEIPVSFGELSNIAMIGGQMNIAQDQLASFTKTVATFVATADGMNLDSATQMFGRLQNLFNTKANGDIIDPNFFDRIGSAISKTADNSVTSEKAISEMINKVGAIGKQAGMSAEDVVAFSSALSSVKVAPYAASGTMTRFFANLNSAVAEGSPLLDKYSQALGVSTDEFRNMVSNDPAAVLKGVVKYISEMQGSVAKFKGLSDLGIKGTIDPRTIAALSTQLHVLEGAYEDVNSAYADGTYLGKSAQGIFSTTAANAKMFTNTLANLGDTLGKNALPYLTMFLKVVTEGVNAFTGFLDAVPVVKSLVGVLLTVAAARGAWMLFRSALVFVQAGLNGFRHTAQVLGSNAATTSATINTLRATMAALRGESAASVTTNTAVSTSLRAEAQASTLASTALAQQTVQAGRVAAASALMATANSNAARSIAGLSGRTVMNPTTVAMLSNYTSQVQNAGRASAAASGRMGGFAATMGTLRTAAANTGSAMKTLGSGLLAAAGGPIGAAALAVASLGAAWYQSAKDTEAGAKSIIQQFETVGSQVEKLKSLSENVNNKGLDLWSFFAGPDDWGKSVGDKMRELNLPIRGLAEAIDGGSESLSKYRAELDRLKTELLTKGGTSEEIDANQKLSDSYRMVATYVRSLEEEARKNEQTQKDTGLSTEELAKSNSVLAGSSEDVTSATTDETSALDKLSSALDKAIQGVFGLSDARGALTNAMSGLGESIASNGTSFDVGTTSGADNLSKLQAVLKAQAQVFNQQIQAGELSAQTAATQYGQFVQQLMSQLTSMGVDTSAIRDVADASVSAFRGAIYSANADGSLDLVVGADVQDAQSTVTEFMQGAYDTFNNSDLRAIVSADTSLAGSEVQSLFDYIIANTNMDYTAILTAIGDPASSEAQNLSRYLTEIVNNGKYEASIGADTSVGATNVMNYANWAQGILAQLQGNLNTVNQQLAQARADGNALGILAYSGAQYVLQTQISALQSAGYQDKATKSATQAIPAYKGMGDAMKNGYDKGAKAADSAAGSGNKASKAAKGAGDSATKAGNAAESANKKALDSAQKALDKLKEWDAAYKAIADYAGRVNTAFGYANTFSTGVQEAKDAYYQAFNDAKKRADDLKQSIKDLRAENKGLKADMNEDLSKAAVLEYNAQTARAGGNDVVAKQFEAEAKALRKAADEKKAKIKANEKEASTIEKGMNNTKGYTDAAIANREELRKLNKAAQDVATAYANAGGSATTVKNKTVEWTNKAKAHSKQLGYTKTDIGKVTTSTKDLITMLSKVPTSKQINIAEKRVTTLQAKNETKSPTDAAKKAIGSVPSSKTTGIKAKADTKSINAAMNKIPNSKTVKLALKPGYAPGYAGAITYVAPNGKQQSGGKLVVNNRGGYIGADQRMSGFASGGLIPGKSPSNPRVDNMFARVDGKGLVGIRSGEFVMRQESVDYYGQSFMNKLNQMQLPRYNMGGMIGKSVNANLNGGVVDLSTETIMAIAKATAPVVALYADSQELARSVNKGNQTLIARGARI